MSTSRTLTYVVGALLTISSRGFAATLPIQINPGPGTFEFVDAKGDSSKRMTVYTYLPKSVDVKKAPIVFVMHGHGKNAVGYRDRWIEEADRYRFLLLVPHFDAEQWKGGSYSIASDREEGGGLLQDQSHWSYNVIEHLFDAVREAVHNSNERYSIYGHSEGGQFVHRLVLLLPDARYERAVVANPGWYMMPKFDVKFPYGLKDTPVTPASLTRSLERNVVIMLGDQDTDPNHPDLRKTKKAMAQGAYRLERGQNFFKEAKARAEELKAKFGWKLRIAPGVAHSDSQMHKSAAEALMEP